MFLAPSLLFLLASYSHIPGVSADVISDLTGKGFTATYPGASNYTTASQPYNFRYAYKPAVITYPTTIDQVSLIVKVAKADGYNVVARSGGHSYVANGLGGKDGSIVIDMQNFKTITYDSSTQTAVIGVGNRLGNIITTLGNRGRALPHGTCAYVGWGGHATYGGYGFTSRMWGLALDSVISADVVLANGTIAKASKTQNPDLFFAIRGAAGSFGIVTSTQVQTYAAPSSATIFNYNYNLNINAAATALANFQTYAMSNIPAQLGLEIVLSKGSSRGTVNFGVVGGWYGAANLLNATLQPFLGPLGNPSRKTVTPGSYLDSAKNLAGGSLDTSNPLGQHDTFYAKSLVTPQSSPMSQTALKAFATYISSNGYDASVPWFLQIELFGGSNSAINAIASADTAFAHRNSLFTMQLYAYSSDNNPPFPADGFTFIDGAADSVVKNSPANWDCGAYQPYIDDRLANSEFLYYKNNLPKLKTLKAQFDPTGVFNSPTGIKAKDRPNSFVYLH
ncbi:glucooligosaccharide oxidase [Ephemerocybe angulata]|uniref:Glucooligosaccharide oxidase n=1 Tax=Ephemerocybe angulata TaxID=980116 RepID=A0A8H6LT59_9AGAR|nr:glucooligosaccharide oxidase [Tulosesus angulatus]